MNFSQTNHWSKDKKPFNWKLLNYLILQNTLIIQKYTVKHRFLEPFFF